MKYSIRFLVMLIVSAPAFADENVYVRLYGQRVQLAKAAVRKQQAETKFQEGRLRRARILFEKKAIAQEELERTEADYQMSVAEEDLFKAKVGEEEATLDVVKLLVQTSQPVPLCRE